ncbi:MAG: AAA family ATPase, partial [Acidimicrobiia bacterium]
MSRLHSAAPAAFPAVPSPAPVIEALTVALSVRAPVLLWGSPGCGKTSVVRALAAAAGWPCEVVVASIHDPTDFSGLPVVRGAEVELAPPRWARRLAGDGPAVLFLDELTTAPPAVQAALLRVVLERTVGDLDLGPQVAVVAAANPPGEAAGGWDLSPPLANRFCHLEWRLDAGAFAAGLSAGWPPLRLPAGALADGPEPGPSRGLVAAFVTARPSLLCAVPTGEAAGRAWPSPRTWELVARLLDAARWTGVSAEAQHLLLAGAVGEGAALEFTAWEAALDLPDP